MTDETAYPLSEEMSKRVSYTGGSIHQGFSKREAIAKDLLAGMCAGYDPESKTNGRFIPEGDNILLAQSAVHMADMLLKALEAPSK